MVGIKALSLLAIAGSALAAPQAGFPNGPHVVTVSDIHFTTILVTVTAGVAGETPVPAIPTPAAAPVTTSAAPVVVVETPAPAAATTAAAAAPAAPVAAPASGSSDTGYMAIVNQYRSAMGLSTLSQDGTLEANALKTCDESGGQLKHELNPGSMAQVLAPGSMGDFEKVYVGGWLCEVPSASGLNGICSSMSAGWDYQGQTGHADILSSTSYSKIGCASSSNVVACDLA